MASIDVTGTSYWDCGLPLEQSGRVAAAVIKATNGTATATVTTDADGDFSLAGLDDSQDLALVLLHEAAQVTRITKKAGTFGAPLALRMTPAAGRATPLVGLIALAVCIVLLTVLCVRYLSTHSITAAATGTARTTLITALKALPATVQRDTGSVLPGGIAAVRQAKEALMRTRTPPGDAVSDTLESIVTYRLRVGARDMHDLIALRDTAVSQLRASHGGYFWTARPWIWIELWCWGLFGVLLNKIVRIGWYLRTSSYHPRGTWMHLAHVVATPFLALVAVLILSFLKVQNDNQTIVDLSDPLFMVLAAFLLSTNPWGLWDFILGQGDRLRSKSSDAAND